MWLWFVVFIERSWKLISFKERSFNFNCLIRIAKMTFKSELWSICIILLCKDMNLTLFSSCLKIVQEIWKALSTSINSFRNLMFLSVSLISKMTLRIFWTWKNWIISWKDWVWIWIWVDSWDCWTMNDKLIDCWDVKDCWKTVKLSEYIDFEDWANFEKILKFEKKNSSARRKHK